MPIPFSADEKQVRKNKKKPFVNPASTKSLIKLMRKDKEEREYKKYKKSKKKKNISIKAKVIY